MELKKLLAGHLLLLALVFPHSISAEDFTFNVGVNFTNLHPDVTTVKIVCQAFRQPGASIVGVGVENLKVPANGAINQTVKVKVNAIVDGGETHPEEAKNYTCQFFLQTKTPGNIEPLPAGNNLCNDTNNDFKCAQKGAQFIAKLTGSISGGSAGSSSAIKTRSGVSIGFEDKN
jgi:hypothetical protein